MESWTLAELTDLAARALVDAGVRAASGRVTGVPDARLVRWYTTIGLLDRPTLGSGRVARYGERHLLQVVAVKRLQAQGLPLAQIQHRLAGATDAQLRKVAHLPAGLTDTPSADNPSADNPSAEPRSAKPPSADAPATEEPFWTRRAAAVDSAGDTVSRVYGLRLPGLTLLLSAQPASEDLDQIAMAARPLLETLAAFGLIEGTPR